MTDAYFQPFRENVIGDGLLFPTPYGEKQLLYADWIASGRLYAPIEQTFLNDIYPYCGNTHTETSVTGTIMTRLYHDAKEVIKKAVNAHADDALIFSGSGMTDSINKLQRIMGLRMPDALQYRYGHSSQHWHLPEADKPVVFITHMEHHSNHTSWLETIADVEIIQPDEAGLPDLNYFHDLLKKYASRKTKIASVSAASNVTGVITPYYEIAEMIHAVGGIIIVDFACSGPYVHIDMHPDNEAQVLDAIVLSPHKFLGGPGTPGLLVMNQALYQSKSPDHAGGGTVVFTSPWHEHRYIVNIEEREDGGTPPFLQGIKAAMAFRLKDTMGVANILGREAQQIERVMQRLLPVKGLHVLESHLRHRVGAVSFYVEGMHYNLGVKLLNDMFGIQVRGGCACAGTYGHFLLNIDKAQSDHILACVMAGDITARPGWIRLSLHPVISDAELERILDAIVYVAENHETLGQDYNFLPKKNAFEHKHFQRVFEQNITERLFA
ncbi:MAG: aminotransferase class V-fold PLP-dependent enzyme [Chitinophagaceae bacterium]